MNSVLDTLVERFREAQDIAVAALVQTLHIPLPATNHDWLQICVEQEIDCRCEREGIRIYAHGYGIELKIGDLTIDFDWGENGEPDGFDVWRLWNFDCDNGGSIPCSYELIQRWLAAAHSAGELTNSGTLYYDPRRRTREPS
jgi:hypothetical protein